MRTVMIALLAAAIGAAAFHIYYRGLDAAARCNWDNPFDARARAGCIAGQSTGYGRDARHKLDDLIGTVSH